MRTERWRDIERLYHAAIDHPPEAREEYLANACVDPDLRREIETLLSLDGPAESFMAVPALEAAARELAADEPLEKLPRRLGPYDIIEPLGAGGMGRVLRARDIRLRRYVALKILPEPLIANPVARERLRREALAAATLDHPFICKVFDFAEHQGVLCVATELVEGVTLESRLRSGPIEYAEALRLIGEIAEALEAAHARRVIHRDLKPSNVMVTVHGRIKVVDFGLAKQLPPRETDSSADSLAKDLTADFVRIGTPAYMSPEHLTGQPLDARSDLFSFGILSCELLTGVHPFRRPTAGGTIAAVLHEPPRIDCGDRPLPAALLLLLRRLLARDPGDRYQTISEVRTDLATVAAAVAGAHALPDFPGTSGRRFPLVGREQEHDRLRRDLAQAIGGHGRLVLISGEPGVGKTRLAQEILRDAEQHGCVCGVGHCRESEGAPPYAPFADILEHLAETMPRGHLRSLLGDSAPDIARLMPDVVRLFKDVSPALDVPPQQERRYLFNAYRDFLKRLARVTPLVVVLEDLQWSDEPTLLLLQHLARSAASVPLLILGTYRDVELDVRKPLVRTLEILVRERLVTRMSLRRLPLESVESLVTVLSGQTPPRWLTPLIFEHTEGNPFFVEEVFRHLSEEGKLFEPSGAWRANLRASDLQVPESVRLVIGRRLERLSDTTVQILTTAAIIGRTFSVPLLERLHPHGSHAPFDAVTDAIEQAETARLLAAEESGREPRYRFVHELIRQTMVEAVSLPKRQRLHAKVAAAIEDSTGPAVTKHAPAIAHHLVQAGAAADPEKTRTYLQLAAEQARNSAAYEEAVTHLDSALTLLEDECSGRVAEIHERRAEALRSLGRFDLAAAAYERAIEIHDHTGDTLKLASATFPLTLIHAWNADFRQQLAATSRALDRLSDTTPVLRCRVLFLHALGLTGSGRTEAGIQVLEQARSLERTQNDPSLHAFSQFLEAHVRYHSMQIRDSLTASAEAMRICEATGDAWGYVDMEWHQVMAAIYLGRPADARRLIAQARPRAERIGHYNVLWFYLLATAALRLADGSLAEAAKDAQEARLLGEQYRIRWLCFCDLCLAQAAFYQGDMARALDGYRRAMASEPPGYWSGVSRSALFAAVAQTRGAEALDLLAEAPVRLPDPATANSFGSWVNLTYVIEGLAWCDRHDDAGALHDAAEALIDTGVQCFRDMRLFRTAAAIAAASKERWSRAEEHFLAAMQQADATPFRVARAHARMWYAQMLLRRAGGSDSLRARDLLEQARSMFTSLGMPTFVSKATELVARVPAA